MITSPSRTCSRPSCGAVPPPAAAGARAIEPAKRSECVPTSVRTTASGNGSLVLLTRASAVSDAAGSASRSTSATPKASVALHAGPAASIVTVPRRQTSGPEPKSPSVWNWKYAPPLSDRAALPAASAERAS